MRWSLRLGVMALLGAATLPACAGDDDSAGDGPGVRISAAEPGKGDEGSVGLGWYELASLAANRALLADTFGQAGYAPPADSYLIVARVLDGVDQPAFEYYSFGDTGFAYSEGRFWPASTVKLMASIGGLLTLAEYGLTGSATVTLKDADGSYTGSVRDLYRRAIEVSDNVAYNRMMEIAGFDETNERYLVGETGLPNMVLQRRYTHPAPDANLRSSPRISYTEGDNTGVIDERLGTGQHPECPNEANCTTLFELMEALRRVSLHDEVPAEHRFGLAPVDVDALKQSLLVSPSLMAEGAQAALGHQPLVYNKLGFVPHDDRLDHGLIVDPVTGERYLVALSMPYDATTDAMANELTRQALLAVRQHPATAAPLQRDAGAPIRATFASGRVLLDAPGADALEAWLDDKPLAVVGGAVDVSLLASGVHLLIARASAAGIALGYARFRIEVAP